MFTILPIRPMRLSPSFTSNDPEVTKYMEDTNSPWCISLSSGDVRSVQKYRDIALKALSLK